MLNIVKCNHFIICAEPLAYITLIFSIKLHFPLHIYFITVYVGYICICDANATLVIGFDIYY